MKAIIINGKGGVGKDTICDIVSKYYKTRNISSIDPIKKVAKELGWLGGKEPRDRKFLSDLKDLSLNYNDLIHSFLVDNILSSNEDLDVDIIFIHIREPEEIEKLVNTCKELGVECLTLLIRNKDSSKLLGNKSDDSVEKYDYDYVYNNIYPLEDLENDFMDHFNSIMS